MRMSENEVSHVTEENINLKNMNNNFSEEEKSRLVELILCQTEFLLDDKIISEIDALPSVSEKILRRLDLLMKIFNIKSYSDANDWLFKIHIQCLMFEDQKYDEDMVISTIAKLLENKKKNDVNPVAFNYLNNNDADKKYSKNENKEKTFWKNASKVLDDETMDVWKILDKQLAKYYGLLKQRKETIFANEDLKKENENLKNLLDQYLQQEVKLLYPPKIV